MCEKETGVTPRLHAKEHEYRRNTKRGALALCGKQPGVIPAAVAAKRTRCRLHQAARLPGRAVRRTAGRLAIANELNANGMPTARGAHGLAPASTTS